MDLHQITRGFSSGNNFPTFKVSISVTANTLRYDLNRPQTHTKTPLTPGQKKKIHKKTFNSRFYFYL